jgi:hypothetical protein
MLSRLSERTLASIGDNRRRQAQRSLESFGQGSQTPKPDGLTSVPAEIEGPVSVKCASVLQTRSDSLGGTKKTDVQVVLGEQDDFFLVVPTVIPFKTSEQFGHGPRVVDLSMLTHAHRQRAHRGD